MSKHYLLFALFALVLIGCRSTIVDDPTTTINFNVSVASNVKVEVENSYNTVIAVPVDGYRAPGNYSVPINDSFWREGIYYYTIECRGVDSNYYYKSTKTMLLIK
jgi:hypothetical protein